MKCLSVKIFPGPNSFAPDLLVVTTDLPQTCYPFDAAVDFRIEVQAGTGELYCEENFPGVPVTVV